MESSTGSSGQGKRHMLLLLILAGGICIVIWYYYIRPLNAELAELQQSIDQLTAQVKAAQAKQAQLPEIQEQIRQSEEKLKVLQRVLPSGKETAEVVRRVQEMAVASELHLKSFTPQGTVQKEFYQDWPILLSVEGNFDSLGIFLEKIGRFERLINVDDLAIRPLDPEEMSRSRTIAATCTATTFVFQEASHEL